jgi:hypothetical protein
MTIRASLDVFASVRCPAVSFMTKLVVFLNSFPCFMVRSFWPAFTLAKELRRPKLIQTLRIERFWYVPPLGLMLKRGTLSRD